MVQQTWSQCLQGAKVRNWTPIQIIITTTTKMFVMFAYVLELGKDWLILGLQNLNLMRFLGKQGLHSCSCVQIPGGG
jgi:hypothetical protein